MRMLAQQQSLFEFDRVHSSLVAELQAFEFKGRRTECIDRNGVPFFYNEFWTAQQRQAHALHEISYRACFKPQLPAFFIERLTSEGDMVYDPFVGRGTTPIQAALMHRHSIGNDINPLSIYLTRPRISPPSLRQIAARLEEILWDHEFQENDELLTFFHPRTLSAIYALRRYLFEREHRGCLDPIDDWIRMVAINRLTGHSSGFFSVYSMPPNQAVSIATQRKINEKRNQVPPFRNASAIILKKSKSLLKNGVPPAGVEARFHTASADRTSDIATGAVDLVVTSPPFLDVVQYASDNWLRCWFAGIDGGAVKIAMHRKTEDWTAFVRGVFKELSRVVRPGGHVAFEVGEVRNGEIHLEQLVLQAIEGLALDPLCVVINVQEFTKTANCWGVDNNSKGTNSNRIVVVRRQ